MWWLPFAEFFGKIALKIGLKALEKKFPGAAPLFDQIIGWLQTQAASGNQQAVQVLKDHVDNLCTGVGCPASLVKE